MPVYADSFTQQRLNEGIGLSHLEARPDYQLPAQIGGVDVE